MFPSGSSDMDGLEPSLRPASALAPNGGEPPTGNSPIDFRELVQLLSERWWLVLLVGLLAGGSAFYLMSEAKARFSSKAVLQVAQEDQRLLGIDEVLRQDLRASEVLNTIVANIKNSSVMLRVVRANNLTVDPAFVPDRTNALTDERAAMALSGMVTCKLRKDTRLIDLTVTHQDPRMARKLADSVAHEFIRQNMDQRYDTTKAANELLHLEAARLKARLEESERALLRYREAHNLVSEDERTSAMTEQLASLEKSRSEARATRLVLEADLEQMRRCSNLVEVLLTIPAVLNDATVEALRPKVIEMEAKVRTLAQRYKSNHPAMKQAQEELNQHSQSLREVVMKIPAVVESAYREAKAREEHLTSALKSAERESLAMANLGIDFHVLKRDVESDRALYDSVVKRLKETDVTKGLERHSIAIVEPAGRPVLQPTRSRKAFAGIASLAGMGAIFGLMVLLRLLDGSLRSVDRTEQEVGLPVVATVPAVSGSGHKRIPLVVQSHGSSPEAEAFRTLRAVSYAIGGYKRGSSHLFTSAVPGEGKTFSSLNYALCLAQEGRKTLLIDMDLRNPSLATALGMSNEGAGGAEVLAGRCDLTAAVRPTVYPNLFLLTAGQESVTDVLTQSAVQRMLEEAAREFERIVIDSAPINSVGDTLLILPAVTFPFLVVRAGSTPRRAVQRAVELMARCRSVPRGIVMNFMPANAGFGNYYSYGQGYPRRKSQELVVAGEPNRDYQP